MSFCEADRGLTIDERLSSHPDKEVGVSKPLNCVLDTCDCSKCDLGVKRIHHSRYEPAPSVSDTSHTGIDPLRFDRMLRHDRLKVVIQLILRGTDITNTTRLVPWTTCSTEDLLVSHLTAGCEVMSRLACSTSKIDRSTKAPRELS